MITLPLIIAPDNKMEAITHFLVLIMAPLEDAGDNEKAAVGVGIAMIHPLNRSSSSTLIFKKQSMCVCVCGYTFKAWCMSVPELT